MGDANSFGKYFRWTTFGESHGVALGVVIDGCPAGVIVSADLLAENLKRRRPGQNDASGEVLVSARNEEDEVQIVSGIYSGKTLGTPIACLIYNKDQRSQDYEDIKKQPRIGHADDVWQKKFSHADHRGEGAPVREKQ